MGDGRILERTAVFIDTLSAACRLPVQGNRTETVDIYTKNQKCNQQSGQLICRNGLAALFFSKNGGFTMAAKKKIINIKVYFDGDQDAKEVFAEVIAQKIRDTKTKDKLAIMKDKQYNDYEFSNLKSA